MSISWLVASKPLRRGRAQLRRPAARRQRSADRRARRRWRRSAGRRPARKCVEHHHQRTRRHAGAGGPGRQPADQRQRDADQVVEHCPDQVLANHAPARVARAGGRRQSTSRRADSNTASDCSWLRCAAMAERDRDIGLRQHRRIVDAVADHQHTAALRPARAASSASLCSGRSAAAGIARCRAGAPARPRLAGWSPDAIVRCRRRRAAAGAPPSAASAAQRFGELEARSTLRRSAPKQTAVAVASSADCARRPSCVPPAV